MIQEDYPTTSNMMKEKKIYKPQDKTMFKLLKFITENYPELLIEFNDKYKTEVKKK